MSFFEWVGSHFFGCNLSPFITFRYFFVNLPSPLSRATHFLNGPITLLFIIVFLTKPFFFSEARVHLHILKNSCSKSFWKLPSKIFMVESFLCALAYLPVSFQKAILQRTCQWSVPVKRNSTVEVLGISELFQNALRKHFSWSLFLSKSEFLDCRPLSLKKKGAPLQRVLFEHHFLCDHFQKGICSVLSMKESSTTYVFLDVF